MEKWWVNLSILIVILLSAFTTRAAGQKNTLIPFRLQDQFGVTYTDEAYKDYYVILVGGDRKGSQYCFIWSDSIKSELRNDPLKEKIKVLGIADLQTAPSYLQSFIKGKFPSERKYWVLLDWEGIFAGAYLFQPDVSNIILFNPEGKRFYSTTVTEVEKAALKKIFSALHMEDLSN
jgi:hypothetical protein